MSLDCAELHRVADELPDEAVAPVAAIVRLSLAIHRQGIPWAQIAAALGTPTPGPALYALARLAGAATAASAALTSPREGLEAVTAETMRQVGALGQVTEETMRMIRGEP